LFDEETVMEKKIKFTRVTIIKYHRLGGLNNKFIFLQYWRLEVQDQGISIFEALLKPYPRVCRGLSCLATFHMVIPQDAGHLCPNLSFYKKIVLE
jgi:hypothetical protein